MKKLLKVILIIIIVVISLLLIFISEECIRLKSNEAAKPLIITDRTKYCVTCIRPGEEIEVTYWSIGYNVKVRYYLQEESSDDNKIIIIAGKEFLLFNKFRLWAWIT